jgi:hypothetical protein
MTTVIYNCKRCKTGRRVDYPLVHGGSGVAMRLDANGKRVVSGVWVMACGGGKPTEYGGDVEMGLCPNCHRAMEYGALVGRFDPSHKCDARCEGARGHNCECSCGGANHGLAWAA